MHLNKGECDSIFCVIKLYYIYCSCIIKHNIQFIANISKGDKGLWCSEYLSCTGLKFVLKNKDSTVKLSRNQCLNIQRHIIIKYNTVNNTKEQIGILQPTNLFNFHKFLIMKQI